MLWSEQTVDLRDSSAVSEVLQFRVPTHGRPGVRIRQGDAWHLLPRSRGFRAVVNYTIDWSLKMED
jgi:hypothetical protein